MGCAPSAPRSEEDTASSVRSTQLDRQLKADHAKVKNSVRVLLLGAGESGKSTIVKQMKLLYGKTWEDQERIEYRDVIWGNTLQSMQAVLDAMAETAVRLTPEILPYAEHLELLSLDSDSRDGKTVEAIEALWRYEPLRELVLAKNHTFQLNDSAPYFFDHARRFADPSQLPTDDDILRARVKSTGISESSYQFSNLTWRVLDVGGQRSERRKWASLFEGVEVLLFLVSIAEYNQVLYEDESTNRLREAETLFESICGSRWFSTSTIVLLLNKTDLFADKLKRDDLCNWIPEYDGPKNDPKTAFRFLSARFQALRKNHASPFHVYGCCATDSTATKAVLSSVQEVVVRNLLKKAEML